MMKSGCETKNMAVCNVFRPGMGRVDSVFIDTPIIVNSGVDLILLSRLDYNTRHANP